MARCLYNSTIYEFLQSPPELLLGQFVNNYHGTALTTTNEAWACEIDIMKETHLDRFDNWIKSFAKPEYVCEIDVDTSKYRYVHRLAKFFNLPELSQMFASVTSFYSVQEETGLPFQSEVDGVSHACGHDIHTAKNIRYYYADVPENTGVPHVDRINELMAKVKELENNLPVMGTLSGALCIVDGKETELDTASLKTEDIISVIIRKPGSKEALAYGDKGKNGVVFIATRNGVKNRSAMETSPLIIIDGKKSSGKDLAALQAEDIVSMKVLKNGEEVKKYTDEDVSGVILIYTRKKR